VRGVNVLWKRSPIQPVPPWADICDLCGKSINSVSAKVSYVNAKLLGPWKVRYRKTVKMKHICRDCREAVRPLQREQRERWTRMKAEMEMHNAKLSGGGTPSAEADCSHLVCDQCGAEETPPYDAGDACVCGGVFRSANIYSPTSRKPQVS